MDCWTEVGHGQWIVGLRWVMDSGLFGRLRWVMVSGLLD